MNHQFWIPTREILGREIAYMTEDLTKGGRNGCAVIVQKDGYGRILGAAAINFTPSS